MGEILTPAAQVSDSLRAHQNLPGFLLDETALLRIKPTAVGVQDGEAVREVSEGDFVDQGGVSTRETFSCGRRVPCAQDEGIASHAGPDPAGTRELPGAAESDEPTILQEEAEDAEPRVRVNPGK